MMESLTEDMVQGAKEIIDEVGPTPGASMICQPGRYLRTHVFFLEHSSQEETRQRARGAAGVCVLNDVFVYAVL